MRRAHDLWSSAARLSAVLGIAIAIPSTAVAQKAPLRGFDAYVERALRDWGVPGMAIAVVKNDSVVFAKGYGVRELGTTASVDARTIFGIASTTKAFTAAALGMLVDSAKLAWDDPVTKHLPWFQLSDPYVTRELTVRDLLSHRSGLPRGDRLWYASGFDRTDVLRRVRYLRPRWSFRATYGYQNVMFMAAGEVAAAASGVAWSDFLQRRIFAPLGMMRTSTSITTFGGDGNVAMPHDVIDDTVRMIPWRNMDNLGPAGSLNSSALDIAQWIRLQLGSGVYRGQRLLSDSVMDEMHTPQMVIRMSKQTREMFTDTHFMAYGLGWSLRDYHGRKVVGHGGAIDGMRTEIGMVPEERLGVVVLANLDGTSFPTAILYRVLDAYMGAPERDWSAVMLKAEREQKIRADSTRRVFESARVAGTRPSLSLNRYAGTYSDSLYGDVEVTTEGDRLVAAMGPSFVGDLEHWHFDTYKVRWRDRGLGTTYFTFTLNAKGEVESLRVDQLGDFGRSAREQKVGTGSP
jgi:CubicO group peptidase (beta-lactamase class C family)